MALATFRSRSTRRYSSSSPPLCNTIRNGMVLIRHALIHGLFGGVVVDGVGERLRDVLSSGAVDGMENQRVDAARHILKSSKAHVVDGGLVGEDFLVDEYFHRNTPIVMSQATARAAAAMLKDWMRAAEVTTFHPILYRG